MLGTRSPCDRAVGPEDFLLEGTMGECEKTEGEGNVRMISTSDSTSEPDAGVKSHMTSSCFLFRVLTREIGSGVSVVLSERACFIFGTRQMPNSKV